MRKWKTPAVAIATLLIALTLLTRSRAPIEPEYQGCPLHHWVQTLNTTNSGPESDAQKAIDHIGTNALPFLVNWIAYDPHPTKVGRFTANLLVAIPAARKLGPIRRWVYPDQNQVALAESAKCSFRVLGPRAAPAVPALASLLGPSKDPGVAPCAVDALCCIGPAAMPALINALTNGNPDARFWSATAMTSMGTNARPAVPALIVCLKAPAADRAAFLALGALKLEPELVVPALTDILTILIPRCDFLPSLRSVISDPRLAPPCRPFGRPFWMPILMCA